MRSYSNKIKRQCEIIGIIISSSAEVNIPELSVIFNCEELTIKRDLQEMRGMGIDIHSTKRGGVKIAQLPDKKSLDELLMDYAHITAFNRSFSKAISVLSDKLNEKAIVFLTFIQRAIEKGQFIRIRYIKNDSGKQSERKVCPLLIFESDGKWRLLAVHENKRKQFLLNCILDVHILDDHFICEFNTTGDFFGNSFRSWIGDDRIEVKLELGLPWKNRVGSIFINETQEISIQPDGRTILKVTVNSLSEIAAWIVSRGYGLVVIEPEELKAKVISLAKESLRNYEESE